MSHLIISITRKKILLLGSGFVAEPCVEHLLKRPENELTIGCRRLHVAQELAKKFDRATAVSVDVNSSSDLDALIEKHDLVISLIPYIHHTKVMESALKFKRNVVTTSYVSDAIRSLDQKAKDQGCVIMNEIGLDPGIDHLYAVKTIEEVHSQGGKIIDFISYCGGLPAPESATNPLKYKFSWSSRGVLLALRNPAKYWNNGQVVEIPGPKLMNSAQKIDAHPDLELVGYPNRDSTNYKKLYNIPEAQTVLRGTLRYKGFPEFIQALVALNLLDDTPNPLLASDSQPLPWNVFMSKLLKSVADDQSSLEDATRNLLDLPETEKSRIIQGLNWMGIFSPNPVKLAGTNLDALCALLEEKMQYEKGERDMIVLQHRFLIENSDGSRKTRLCTMIEYGNPNGFSAMARTVGVPCGIATQLVLDGVISTPGVHAPMNMKLNEPIMKLIEKEGITVEENDYPI